MSTIESLTPFLDEKGNQIEYTGEPVPCSITFRGKNNRLIISGRAKIGYLAVSFDCDNGQCILGAGGLIRGALKFNIRIGQDSSVIVEDDVTTTGRTYISAAEGTTARIGRDSMLASGIEIRTDDSHPIFDVRTGERVNESQDVEIGEHVWVGSGAAIMGGAKIGEGSVIGRGAIVTKCIPNNCVAAGVPAKVVRKDIAWERPHLTLTKPFLKRTANDVVKSGYWMLTRE